MGSEYVDRRKSLASIGTTKSLITRTLTRRDTTTDLFDQETSTKGSIGLTTLYNPPDGIVVDLIFVHGVNGGSQSTWTKNGDPSLFWPQEWLPKDQAFQDVRIHTFGYASAIAQESVLNIPDFARSLLYSIHDSPVITREGKVGVFWTLSRAHGFNSLTARYYSGTIGLRWPQHGWAGHQESIHSRP